MRCTHRRIIFLGRAGRAMGADPRKGCECSRGRRRKLPIGPCRVYERKLRLSGTGITRSLALGSVLPILHQAAG